MRALFLFLSLTMFVVACTPERAVRGNLLQNHDLQKIVVGESDKYQIQTLFGPPTAMDTFQPNTWIYVGEAIKQEAFFRPELVERRVLKIQFDDDGIVQAVNFADKRDGEEIETVDYQTPTSGRELGILEQLIGNVGRYTPSGGNASSNSDF